MTTTVIAPGVNTHDPVTTGLPTVNLTSGTAGTFYSDSISFTPIYPAVTPMQYRVESGSLPPGLTFEFGPTPEKIPPTPPWGDGNTYQMGISGTPTTPGTYTFVISAISGSPA